MTHIPVLLKETIATLNPKQNENFIDCTFGFGGHSLAILEKISPSGIVLGIEWDKQSLVDLPQGIKQNKRLIIVNDSYVNIATIAKKYNFNDINGILFDLGMSSWHIDASKKGFSFSKDELLDMRYGIDEKITAADIINGWPVASLEKIFNECGQERGAHKIAREIERVRRVSSLKTTKQLVALVEKISPAQKNHSLARIFQALRIVVNREFENIDQGIDVALGILNSGGRLAVITFHSLEDGIVKRKFCDFAKEGKAKLVFKKPIVPQSQEVMANPRARSAKLRAIEKII